MSNSGIYKLYWLNCEYFYYGQSRNINRRFRKHLRRLLHQVHENSKLQNVYNKYGHPELEIIEECDIQCLDETEQKYLDQYFKDSFCCNLSPSANTIKGYKHTEECKRRIGELSKQKVFTEEYREKLRNRKPNMSMLGKKHSDDARKLMSEKHKGQPKTDSWKKKIRDSNRKVSRKNAKKVLNTITGEIYNSINETARLFGIRSDTLKWRLRHSKNYFLKIIENDEVHHLAA